MSDRLDRQLTDWGTAARAAAAPPDVPTDRLVGPRTRRPIVAMAAAAVVIMAAAVTAIIVTRPDSSRPGPAAQPTAHVVAPGYRPVDVGGLAIDVPAAWPTNATFCGTPRADTVVTEPDGLTCLAPLPAGISYAEFIHAGQLPPPRGAAESITVSGRPARKYAWVDGASRVVLVWVPAGSIGVLVRSPDPALVDRLVASLRFEAVTADGCSVFAADVGSLISDRAPVRAGAGTMLVPGRPTRVVLCAYQAASVAAGRTLTDTEASTLVSTLNEQPAGYSVSDPRTFDTTLCPERNSTLQTGGEDTFAYRLQADYADGPPVVVVARFGLCGKLGAANGSYSVQRTAALISMLGALLPVGASYQGSIINHDR
jgi:hypothetical protein